MLVNEWRSWEGDWTDFQSINLQVVRSNETRCSPPSDSVARRIRTSHNKHRGFTAHEHKSAGITKNDTFFPQKKQSVPCFAKNSPSNGYYPVAITLTQASLVAQSCISNNASSSRFFFSLLMRVKQHKSALVLTLAAVCSDSASRDSGATCGQQVCPELKTPR